MGLTDSTSVYNRDASVKPIDIMDMMPGSGNTGPKAEQSPDASFMQKLLPDTKFEAPKVDAGALKRDPNMAATDLPAVKQQTASLKSDVKAVQADFAKNWVQAKAELISTIGEVAMERGIDPRAAITTIVPKRGMDDFAAASTLVADMAMGAGSFATFLQGVGALDQIRDETKKISPDEAKSLMEDVQRRLASHAKQRSEMNVFSGGGSSDTDQESKSDFQWQNLQAQDMKNFLGARIEDQPEFQELAAVEFALIEVEENHDLVEARELDGSGNKILAAIERGDENAVTAMVGKAAATAIVSDPRSAFGALAAGQSLKEPPPVAKVAALKLDEETLEKLRSAKPSLDNEFTPPRPGLGMASAIAT